MENQRHGTNTDTYTYNDDSRVQAEYQACHITITVCLPNIQNKLGKCGTADDL
jgi:hypothetical protein